MRETMTIIPHLFGLLETVIIELQLEIIRRTDFNIYFSYSGNQVTVESLLKNGADVNSKSNDNFTALIWAAMKGNFQVQDKKIDRSLSIGIVGKNINIYPFRSSKNG